MTIHELVVAVRNGDADGVRRLLDDDVDADMLDPDAGVPLLCVAVAAYDEDVVDALIDAGADSLAVLPDGSTPVRRAVDGGSIEMVSALTRDPVRFPEGVRHELLELARRWAGAGVAAELRRRSGDRGPVARVVVGDRDGDEVYEQFSVGGLTARDGHDGILTALEASFGVRAPFEEVLTRALVRRNRDHAVWFQAAHTLSRRLDEETWAAAVALGRSEDRLRRLFAAELLLFLGLGSCISSYAPFEERGTEVLLPWAREERDPEVLRAVLNALTENWSPEIEELGRSYLTHPDAGVRCMLPHTLELGESRLVVRPESLKTVFALARDPEPRVRSAACTWLAEYPGHDPGIADALARLVHEEDQVTRIYAVFGLAHQDDPRCVDAERHIGPVDPETWSDTWMLCAVDRYRQRVAKQAAGSG
ncbi:HEAT repeat protein [Streptomyces sp. Ag109_O5-1]|uniref:ankyrin repeat domain-containing protein n=1 Tax=Streptomyces TaxID=1883 RepID=UPI000F501689|nr:MULTISPECIES: HEAT repeat domain-containing protein [Streptomyces]RPE43258.1 HEAT repeat protein [Streptomyces sp. Ag109_O5-1]